jgi:hypothetical protein
MEVDADIGDTISIDADEGDLIVFSSLMLHCTGPNEANSTRVAYVAEYMPLREYAPDMKPPYFVAAEAGNSNAHFIQVQPGSRSVKNQLMYLAPRMARTAKSMFRPVRDAIKGRRPPAR